MKRPGLFPFRDWTWDQLLLILGPVLVSVLLVVLYAGGVAPLSWPALLVVVVLINLAGDVAYAVRNERSVKHGRAGLRNDMIGNRVTADGDFYRDGHSYRGMVLFSGERWRAVSDQRIVAGEPLNVTGRRGLVLDVVSDRF